MSVKIKTIVLVSIMAISIAFQACNNSVKKNTKDKHTDKESTEHNHDEEIEGMAILSPIQRKAIKLKVGKMSMRQMSRIVKITGQLKVPPNNKAEVTSYIDGNVVSINAFQGDKVKKNQVLAILEHPDIIQLQQDFIEKYNNLQYLEKEYNRQKELYNNNVGSGKNFQRVEADYNTAKAQYQGLKLRLKMLKLNTQSIEKGNIVHQLKVLSPIDGYISEININIGSYIDARTKMFSISNFDEIHADLLVYEKNINKIKKNQNVRLHVANMPDNELKGKVFAISKEYDSNSHSITVHVSINNPPKKLIADSYVTGEILTNKEKVNALPETAIVNDGGKKYIFIFDALGSLLVNDIHEELNEDDEHEHNEIGEHEHNEADKHEHNEEEHNSPAKDYDYFKNKKIAYRMVEVIVQQSSDGYVAITPAEKINSDATIVLYGAYYLLSDLKKSEAAHQH